MTFFSEGEAWAAAGSPGRTVAALKLLPWRTPKVVRTPTNSTPPFKFRQTKSCEVRSRLAELSVEWTNESFLSVWQRSSSRRFTLSRAIWGKKVLIKFFPCGLAFRRMKASFSRAAFNCVEKNVNLRQCVELASKSSLVAFASNSAKKLWTKQKNLTLPLIVISPKLPLLFVSILEKFRCF